MRTERDMTNVRRTVPFAKALKNGLKHVDLKDYSGGGNTVHLRWDFNKSATRDKIFALKINETEVLIDLEELLSYTRLM